jgi:hypothetical protein
MKQVISAVTDVYVDTESEPGQVTMNIGHSDYAGPAWLEPAQARELAAVLLQAADETEGVEGPTAEERVQTWAACAMIKREFPGRTVTGRRNLTP